MVDNENTAEAAIHETAPVEDLTSAEGIKNDAAQTTASADATIAGLVVSPLPYLTTQQPHLFITAEQEAAVAGDLTLIGVKSSPPNISVAGSDTLLITEPVLGDSYIVEHQEPTIDVEEGSIWEPALNDVLSGRGASVNSHPGNQKFRALCFSRKAMFDVANHAAKRRIATEIWKTCVASNSSRFLRKPLDKGPWYELGADQAILKAAQVMRDYKRPDRLIQRELIAAAGKKRNRATATPMEDVPIPPPPAEPIVENPAGVHEHDILCGRGAFVNGHTGNQRLRQLAVARKSQFDEGTYTEKRALATEIVSIIKDLTPPGRFLRKAKPTKPLNWPVETIPSVADESEWQEELDLERCIHKACQVMRDIDRQDRKDRDERRRLKKLNTEGKVSVEYHINSSDGNRNDGTAAMPDTAATSDAEKAVHEDNNDSEVADKTNPIAAFEAHEATATGPDIPV